MEATIVREAVSNGRRIMEMSDGRILIEPVSRPKGTQYGTYTTIKGEVTDEKFATAKNMVVDDICRMIREIASDREDFFIIKPTMDGSAVTVGHKFFLPTVDGDDECSRSVVLPIVE